VSIRNGRIQKVSEKFTEQKVWKIVVVRRDNKEDGQYHRVDSNIE
jgi:hypothetical protein